MNPQPSVTIEDGDLNHDIRIIQGVLKVSSTGKGYTPQISFVPLSTATARELAALFAGYVALQEMAAVVG